MYNPQQYARDHLLMRCYAGSRAYGTSLPTSDIDIRGIFIPHRYSIMTPFFQIEQATVPGTDTVYYAFNKFMKLYTECNPNILELLWTDENDIIEEHPGFNHLRQARMDLLSLRVAKTFTGYARSQIVRIMGHNKWINHPQPKTQPQPSDFASKEKFQEAHKNWTSYWDWVANRNPQRSALEHKFGYDTKHAMHCVRLLRMGIEVLEGKGVIVKRPDAEELLSIRAGAWSYDRLVQEAKMLEEYCLAAESLSALPAKFNETFAAQLTLEVLDTYWRWESGNK